MQRRSMQAARQAGVQKQRKNNWRKTVTLMRSGFSARTSKEVGSKFDPSKRKEQIKLLFRSQ
jgi:hypothetical protein